MRAATSDTEFFITQVFILKLIAITVTSSKPNKQTKQNMKWSRYSLSVWKPHEKNATSSFGNELLLIITESYLGRASRRPRKPATGKRAKPSSQSSPQGLCTPLVSFRKWGVRVGLSYKNTARRYVTLVWFCYGKSETYPSTSLRRGAQVTERAARHGGGAATRGRRSLGNLTICRLEVLSEIRPLLYSREGQKQRVGLLWKEEPHLFPFQSSLILRCGSVEI